MKKIRYLFLSISALFIGCAGSSDGSDLEVPTDLPPICRGIDFVSQPDMREICGVRRVRYKAYQNIPQQRYLIKPTNASIVKEKNRIELRLENALPLELTGNIVKEIDFNQAKRLEKIKNTYDYVEFYDKTAGRKRAFKLTIPTDAGTSYDYCFRIPEKKGNARTRSVAMGNKIEPIACFEYENIVKAKQSK